MFKRKNKASDEHFDWSSHLSYDDFVYAFQGGAEEHQEQKQDEEHFETQTKEHIMPDFFSVLNFTSEPDSFEDVQQRFRALVKTVHPDRPGGSHEDFKRLNEAYKEAKEYYGE